MKPYSEGGAIIHSTKKITIIYLSVIFLAFAVLAQTSQAKSLYVIIDRYSTVRAYKIIGEQIEEQIDVQNLDDHGGAVGAKIASKRIYSRIIWV